jgi:S1-C subfamily serine protease
MAARAPGEQVAVDAVRGGKPVKVSVTLAAAATAVSNGAAAFSFATEPGVGTRVSAAPAGSGLQPGDVITRAGAIAAPTPTQLRRLLARPAATGFAVLVVRRDGRQQIVSVPVSPPGDAPR